ncbi:MAG: SPOR domain-containing protein [Spirochaetia bacterium]
MRTRVLLLLVSLLVGGVAVAEPPERNSPLSERIEWLVVNPAHIAVTEIFADVLEDARSMADLDIIRQRIVPALVDRELRRDGLRAIAAVYRTARRLSIAGELYQQAYELSCDSSYDASLATDLESLFAHAQILVELGDLRRADTETRTVLMQTTDYSLKRKAYTLTARIAYERGNSADALEMLDTLASLANTGEAASDLVEVETILLMRQILQAQGDREATARADDLLVHLFPGSVAAGIVTAESRKIALPGLPSALLFAQVAETKEGAGEVGNNLPDLALSVRRDQPRLSAVQVGSFNDADNAEHLTADLRRMGLAARTEAVSRDGSAMYQVVVDIPDGSTENAARILSTLRASGFDGFLVY